MDNSKRKNIYIIVFVVTTIIAASVAVYFGVKASDKSADLQIANKDMEDYKKEITTLKEEMTKSPDVPKKENSEVNNNIATSNKNMLADLSKCINPQKDIVYISSCNEEIENNITIKQGNVLEFANKKYNTSAQKSIIVFSTSEAISENNKIVPHQEYPITGIVGKVIDTVRYRNQVAFLTQDGSVYCYDINEAIKNNRFIAKKISDVSNISKLSLIGSVFEYTEGYTDGHNRIGAIKEDGSFYDLTELINTQFK